MKKVDANIVLWVLHFYAFILLCFLNLLTLFYRVRNSYG
jgi:hypothetical protein